MRRLIFGVCLIWLLVAASCASAQSCTAVLSAKGGTVEIQTTETEDGTWMFLPSFADLSTLHIQEFPDHGQPEPSPDEEGVWLLDTGNQEIRIMQSKNLRTMFLFSDDPVNQGRFYVESDPDHLAEATGSMALVAENGHVDFAGKLTQIRGRGNTTWSKAPKKPFQIKLEDKYDLLNTGDPDERNRTWILLADAIDTSLLHNRIALDFAKEMELDETGHCEHVDLYYDGEYLGPYLLTEKVEVGTGRVDETDYDRLMQKWNRWVGQTDLSVLPLAKGQNALGDPIRYVENIADNGVCDAGAYLVEMYCRGTSAAISGFTLDGDRAFEITSPKYASRDMVCYVSELLSNGLAALQNGGVHPLTGESVEKWFDLESFARVILLNELSRNWDAFILTSTFFLLPAGETRFVAGPVWDFDRTMRNEKYRMEAGYAWGLKDKYGYWACEFYSIPAFMEAVQRIYRDEIAPLVTDILLGTRNGRYLRPLEDYAAEIRPAALMNAKRWPEQHEDHSLHYADNFDDDIRYLRKYFEEQNSWLYQTFLFNGEPDADHINITMKAEWLDTEADLEFWVFPWSRVTVQSYTHEQLTEATEEDYALWRVDVTLAPQEGYAFHTPQVWINNGQFSGEIQPDGTLNVSFLFEDLSYRPVDYYGQDIGLIFNPDFYAFSYPSVAEECEGDPLALMDHFCYDGMYEKYIGNGFFDPEKIAVHNTDVGKALGEEWTLYYWDFLDYGYESGWMKDVNLDYVPPVLPLS